MMLVRNIKIQPNPYLDKWQVIVKSFDGSDNQTTSKNFNSIEDATRYIKTLECVLNKERLFF